MKQIFQIEGIPRKTIVNLPWDQRIEYLRKIEAFKERAKRGYVYAKGRSFEEGLREFKRLYKPAEYYVVDMTARHYKDDVTPIWYTEKKTSQNP